MRISLAQPRRQRLFYVVKSGIDFKKEVINLRKALIEKVVTRVLRYFGPES